MHNGYRNELATFKRDLILAVDPSRTPDIKGHSDTDCSSTRADVRPPLRPSRAHRSGNRPVEAAAENHGVRPVSRARRDQPPPTRDESVRSATPSENASRVRCSTPPTSPTLREMNPERDYLRQVLKNSRRIVSIPSLTSLRWNEVPESTVGIVGTDHSDNPPVRPKAPAWRCPSAALPEPRR